MRSIRVLLLFLVTVVASPSLASTACPEHHLDGVPPAIVQEALAQQAQEFCYSEFGVVHSGLTRTPLWAVERLTSERILAARDVERRDVFAPEERIARQHRAELDDYVRSGYDRGHLAPSADFATREGQAESFLLSNIVPQHPDNNRDLWADIEWAVRDLVVEAGEVYVVTGPIFLGSELQAVGGRVAVPTHMFKAIYVPSRGQAGAYVAQNAEGDQWGAASIDELTELVGIDVFPSLPDSVTSRRMILPER